MYEFRSLCVSIHLFCVQCANISISSRIKIENMMLYCLHVVISSFSLLGR